MIKLPAQSAETRLTMEDNIPQVPEKDNLEILLQHCRVRDRTVLFGFWSPLNHVYQYCSTITICFMPTEYQQWPRV
jgi:hypothetical protein